MKAAMPLGIMIGGALVGALVAGAWEKKPTGFGVAVGAGLGAMAATGLVHVVRRRVELGALNCTGCFGPAR